MADEQELASSKEQVGNMLEQLRAQAGPRGATFAGRVLTPQDTPQTIMQRSPLAQPAQQSKAAMTAIPLPKGMQAGDILEPGNIDIMNRPRVKNPDGTISTVRSMSFDMDGREVLVPTVSEDGRIMSEQEAIDTYIKTGRHLGIFKSPEAATVYGKALHEQQATLK